MHSDEDMLGLLLTEKKELEEGEVNLGLSSCVCTVVVGRVATNVFVFSVGYVGLVCLAW